MRPGAKIQLFTPLSSILSSDPLNDYYRFHGMLCPFGAAHRCIQTFDGIVLFMPATYDPRSFDSAATLPHEVKNLTTLTYYLLVLSSFTGLCSMLCLTETMDARAGADLAPPHKSPHPLAIHPNVLSCLKQRNRRSDIRLVRRFEFRFRLLGLWVCMHHYLTTDSTTNPSTSCEGELNLVEVYTFDRRVLAAWALAATGLVLNAARQLLV